MEDKNVYTPRTLSPTERVAFDNLKAENTELRQIVKEQADALMELAEIISEVGNG